MSSLYACLHDKHQYQFSFAETQNKFIITKLSICKLPWIIVSANNDRLTIFHIYVFYQFGIRETPRKFIIA